MNPYATNSEERKWLPIILAILSILLAWLFNRIFTLLNISIPWYVDAPSVMGFYGLLFTAFEKYLWELSFLRFIKLIKVPNLNGKWEGYLTTSFDDHADKHKVSLEITQNWRNICFNFNAQHSTSHSLTATITIEPNKTYINYEYLNEPSVNSKETMHIHRGTACLVLSDDGQKLEGEYYSGRDRTNMGTLYFKKVDNIH